MTMLLKLKLDKRVRIVHVGIDEIVLEFDKPTGYNEEHVLVAVSYKGDFTDPDALSPEQETCSVARSLFVGQLGGIRII